VLHSVWIEGLLTQETTEEERARARKPPDLLVTQQLFVKPETR
jgi:hypothetical protein